MKKAEKIALALVTALTLVNCGTDVARDTSSPLSGRMPHRDFRWSQYAPTALWDTSSHSLQTPLLGGAGVGSTHYSPIKEDFTALAKKYNFAELEKEYKSFSTKALADTYVKKMFNKFLIVTPNSVQVIRQVEFSRYLKNNGDTSYETSLKNIFTDTPVLYSSLTGMPAVQSKMTSESGTFGFYILGVSPNQTVPNALPATNITETSFTANWSAVSGATSYTLILDGVEITGITGTNHTLNTLTAGSNHKYRVKAISSGVAGAASNEINVNTVLTAPVASSAIGITQTSLTANWSAVTGATSYTLVFNGTETTGITGTSHTVNSLTPGTSYSYYVKAVNANTESVNSNTISTITVPANPSANAASSVTSTSFTANWVAVTGATGYKLFVDSIQVGGTLSSSTTSYAITGLTPETSHTYYVQAINAGGTSQNSNTISVTLNIAGSCLAWKNAGVNVNGVYSVDPDNNISTSNNINVYCDMTTAGGGWTLVSHIYDKDNRDDILNDSNGSGWGNSANTPVSDTSFNVANASTPSYTESKFEWIFPLYSNQTFSHNSDSELVNDRFKWINPNPSAALYKWDMSTLGLPNDPAYGRIDGVFGNVTYPVILGFLNDGSQCGGGPAINKNIHYWGYGALILYGNDSQNELHNIPSVGVNRGVNGTNNGCGTRESILNIWIR